jgi:hypothetical protein
VSGKTYVVCGDVEFLTMQEDRYEAEALLQRLLAEYPCLLAGDHMRPTDPRR